MRICKLPNFFMLITFCSAAPWHTSNAKISTGTRITVMLKDDWMCDQEEE